MSELGKVVPKTNGWNVRLGTCNTNLYHHNVPCRADDSGLGLDTLSPVERGECTPLWRSKARSLKQEATEFIRCWFTVNANCISNNLCNHPKPHIPIVNADDGETAWASPSTFSTAMGCINPPRFELKWRFGYSGERLPYPNAIDYQSYGNHIVMKKAGLYKMMVEFENFVVEREFHVTGSAIEPGLSNEVILLHKGCGLSPVCYAHSILIYGNGTALHREYDMENNRIYIFQIPQNDTTKLFRQFHEADLSMLKTDTFFGTDIVYYEMSFTANDKTTKVFYLGGRHTPQTIPDLDSQIEQLITAQYDDRIIDCIEHSLEDCHVHEPVDQTQSNGDDETGLLNLKQMLESQFPLMLKFLWTMRLA
ncbi:MAG: hypothetical protein AB1351_05725 [Thermoproteota archaeon]